MFDTFVFFWFVCVYGGEGWGVGGGVGAVFSVALPFVNFIT
jgi:hypothetical protein